MRLKDDSCVQIVSQLVNTCTLLPFSATGVVPLPDNEFQHLIDAFDNGDIAYVERSLKVSRISSDRIYSESGSSLNLLHAATTAQEGNIVNVPLTDYSTDLYFTSKDTSLCYIKEIFCYAPQPFIIKILKSYDVLVDFKTSQGLSLLHCAIILSCFDVVSYFLEECSSIDVNVTDSFMRTPLHLAYLCGHTQIAEHLMQHGANENAVDENGCTPCQYVLVTLG